MISPFANLITPSTGFTQDVSALTEAMRQRGEKSDRLPTKERILSATELLFLDRGYDGTSLRAITTEASVNLAAVNYHFGSKEELFTKLLTDRLDPLNEQRRDRLQRLLAAGLSAEHGVEQIIATLFIPALLLARDPIQGGPDFLRFVGRAYADPSDFVRHLLQSRFAPINLGFKQAFSQALPELAERDLGMRLNFILDSVSSTLASEDVRKVIDSLKPSAEAGDTELLSYLAPFLGAALRSKVRQPSLVESLKSI